LLSNALKFTHQGFIEFGYILVNNEDSYKSHYLQFYIKDSGIGIRKEQQEAIFERFRQAELDLSKRYGGTELGLAISKAYVELMGGKIWLNSEFGVGTTFYFTIPYKPVMLKENIVIEKSDLPKTILVVEDEEFNFLYIEEILINQNCILIHAKNGLEAIEICKNNADIQFILMDIKLPLLNGYDAAKQIKLFLHKIPIVALTAYALKSEREKYQDAFDAYLIKPIQIDKLILTMQSLGLKLD
jgi:CheY-like chemotaxis protein